VQRSLQDGAASNKDWGSVWRFAVCIAVLTTAAAVLLWVGSY
jgi:hypothetical protein